MAAVQFGHAVKPVPLMTWQTLMKSWRTATRLKLPNDKCFRLATLSHVGTGVWRPPDMVGMLKISSSERLPPAVHDHVHHLLNIFFLIWTVTSRLHTVLAQDAANVLWQKLQKHIPARSQTIKPHNHLFFVPCVFSALYTSHWNCCHLKKQQLYLSVMKNSNIVFFISIRYNNPYFCGWYYDIDVDIDITLWFIFFSINKNMQITQHKYLLTCDYKKCL